MKINGKLIFHILLFYLFFQPLSGCHNETADQNISIDNGKIKLGFNKQTGSLRYFSDLPNSYDWLEENTNTGSPRAIEFLQPGGIETIDINPAAKFRYSKPITTISLMAKRKLT